MKKLISMLLIVVMVAAMAAGCGQKANTDTTGAADTTAAPVETTEAVVAPESALEVLETVWAQYGEDEMFSVIGGDNVYHNTQMEADETYVMPNAPGEFHLTGEEERAELTYKMLVPETEIDKISDAATLTHFMNSNIFNAGVYKVSDAAAFVETMKTAITGNHWMCGSPESFLIATIAGEYVLVVWGQSDAMGPFQTKFEAAYPDAELVVNEAIAI